MRCGINLILRDSGYEVKNTVGVGDQSAGDGCGLVNGGKDGR